MAKSIDLTTLPGWSSLSTGSHNITIVAKADGYRDSAPSAAVQVEKAEPETAAGTWKFKNIISFANFGKPIIYGNNSPNAKISSCYDINYRDAYGKDLHYFGLGTTDSTGSLPERYNFTLYQGKIVAWASLIDATMYITGGIDANNSTFISWLKANATRQS